MDDLLSEFLTETSENLSVLDVELVRLEQNPNNPELLSNIFRLVHTIKGTCGFLGLPRLEHVAHASENVLGKFRDGELQVSPQAVSAILESLDTIKLILSVLEATEAEPPGDDSGLIARLNAIAEGRDVPARRRPPPPRHPTSYSSPFRHSGQPAAPAAAAPPVASVPAAPAARAPEPEVPATIAAKDLVVHELAPVAAAPAAAPLPRSSAGFTADETRDAGNKESAVAAQTIRVNVDLLENLMTMVSELVLTRNQLLQILRSQKDSEFAAPLQRLNHVTSELQEGVMKTRMQPIGNAWAKLPRLVRDLAHELGKKIDLQMLGADTELDRQVLELIKDPLTHMVRNSADHGLETPAERAALRQDRDRPRDAERLSRGRPHHHRDRGRRTRPQHRPDQAEGPSERAGAGGRTGRHVGQPDPGLHHEAGLLDRREGHQRFRPRRRHGRGQDQHREDRRHDRDEVDLRPGHDLHHQDPADPGDRFRR